MTGAEADLLDPGRQQAAAEAYARIVDFAERDDRVLGLVLGGGRGKGVGRPWSDYDVYVVVDDAVDPQALADEVDDDAVGVEISVNHRDDVPPVWNRYNFLHLEPVVDKLGDGIGGTLARWSSYPVEEAARAARHWLGAYVNQVYRAFKNHRDGLALESRLDAGESAVFFLEALFSMYGRLRPYNKFLRWELEDHPLPGLPWETEELLGLVGRVLGTGAVSASGELLGGALQVAGGRGYGQHIEDEWGRSTLEWLMRYAGEVEERGTLWACRAT